MRRIGLYSGTLIAIFVIGLAALARREEMVGAASLLPVAFEHSDHRDENCIECHHNFVDDTGQGICYVCHKNDPVLALSMQGTFHDFCRGCHLERRIDDEDAGPLRRCSECHASPEPLSTY